MRNELELIEKIERYISGRMTTEEQSAFELQMKNDGSLREAVLNQKQIMQGIDRIAIKQQVVTAGRQYYNSRNFIIWGIGGAIGIVIVVTGLYFLGKLHPNHKSEQEQAVYNGTLLPEFNENGTKDWAMADSTIPAQRFSINSSKDTVIETTGGMVLSIPANAFLGKNGKAYAGDLSLYIKEAFDPFTILQAGLSTKSGDRLLETGGMFFIDARNGNEILKIDPLNGIYAEIPSSNTKPGMQLFSGKRMPDGSIDWIDPKELEQDLRSVNILELDFYPPKYLPELKRERYDVRNKRFTDSLYYSFVVLFDTIGLHDDGESWDSYFLKTSDSSAASFWTCGINPAKIKTIWSSEYQNTLLATREFEERLKHIHHDCGDQVLDLYVNNLDKNLWEIDSMAAKYCSKEEKVFLEFAARRNGKVNKGSKQFDKLKEYYAVKTKLLTEAIAKTEREFREKQEQLENDAEQKRLTKETGYYNKQVENFTTELEIDLNSAYKQLGKERAPVNALRETSTITNAAVITNTGWSNVDRYVAEATISRTTLNYTDPNSGKKAIIEYNTAIVSVKNRNVYDRLLVYLLPDQLNSFQLMQDSSGFFTEKLNSLMQYDLVCVGIKGNQSFYYKANSISAKIYNNIDLKLTDSATLATNLNGLRSSTQVNEIRKEIFYAVWDIGDKKRQKEKAKQTHSC